ncbi:MAG: hypothetical protein RJB62_1172 [Pseudomonadota bacterium]
MPVSTSRTTRSAVGLISLATFFAAAFPSSATAEPVDLELVIATDVSRSVNAEEALLQRQGVAQAFRSAEVVRAIEMGALGKIGVIYVDWSTEYLNKIVVHWTIIHDRMSATGFADALMAAEPNWGQRTSISSVMILASELIETNDLEGTRRAIDISGDGPNNYGLSLAPVRDETLAKGIVINGLPIIVEGAEFGGRGFFPEVDQYYQRCVIGGAGAFLVVARGFEDFANAIRRKLVLEISDASQRIAPRGNPLLIRTSAAPDSILPTPLSPVMGAPLKSDENCDRWGEGFGMP